MIVDRLKSCPETAPPAPLAALLSRLCFASCPRSRQSSCPADSCFSPVHVQQLLSRQNISKGGVQFRNMFGLLLNLELLAVLILHILA